MSVSRKRPAQMHFVEIAERMKPLADFYVKHKPDQRTLRIFGDDMKVIRQWPDMAKRVGIDVSERSARFMGFTLCE